MLLKISIPGFLNRVYRSRRALWVPNCDGMAPLHKNILCVLGTPRGRILMTAHNIVTDQGDKYYAQRGAVETPTLAFANLYLSSVNWDATHPQKTSDSDDIASMISGAEKAKASGYPKTNDGDADNTGAGIDVVSWLFSYTKADFNDTDIDAGAIAISGVTSWGGAGGTDDILTGFALTTFAKTANDTLKVFVNHTMLGV